MIKSILLQVEKTYSTTIYELVKADYPNLEIILIDDLAQLIALPFSTLKNSRLISFSSPNIVPTKILNLLGYGAYNIHPGPPARPGWGAIEKAIYDQDRAFGTTLHAMNEYIDCGPIIAINLFPIPAGAKRQDLVNLAFQNMLSLLIEHLKELVENEDELIELPIEWGHKKFTKTDYSAYCIITEDIDKEELALRIRAFQSPIRPPIRFTRNGKVFALTDQKEASIDAAKAVKLHGYTFVEM